MHTNSSVPYRPATGVTQTLPLGADGERDGQSEGRPKISVSLILNAIERMPQLHGEAGSL